MHNNLPNGILEAVRETLSQPKVPWFPELSSLLTLTAWEKFALRGFAPANYGTNRWLKNDPGADRLCLAEFNLGDSLHCIVEPLPASCQSSYEKAGLIFPTRLSHESDVGALRTALSLIRFIPSLHATVIKYLRSVHILQAPGPNYDVSHSDPRVPFSIFMSIPPKNLEQRLRIAESIIHECMHLQLTLIENMLPLVKLPMVQVFSPWYKTARPLSGVLHGLYVFTVVHEFFETLDKEGLLKPKEKSFTGKRRGQIVEEVTQVASLVSSEGLTNEGRSLVRSLYSCLSL